MPHEVGTSFWLGVRLDKAPQSINDGKKRICRAFRNTERLEKVRLSKPEWRVKEIIGRHDILRQLIGTVTVKERLESA